MRAHAHFIAEAPFERAGLRAAAPASAARAAQLILSTAKAVNTPSFAYKA